MKTVTKAVDDILNNSPFLEEAIGDGIINISSLARKIQEDIESMVKKKVRPSAILMALKRRPIRIDSSTNAKIRNFIHNLGDITVRSHLCNYTFLNSPGLVDKQKNLLNHIGKRDLFYTFSQGVNEMTMVVSNLVNEEIRRLFKDEKLVSQLDNLCSVTIKFPLKNTQLPGIYYYVFKKIAWGGINVLEVISTTNEFTIIVFDKDIDKAFSILKNLSVKG